MNRFAILLAAAGTLSFTVFGCAADTSEDEAPPGEDEVVGMSEEELKSGVTTLTHPEIGKVLNAGGMCTGTLIATRVVLTAAHCINFQTKTGPGQNLGTFVITSPNGATAGYVISRQISYESGPWSMGKAPNDLALLQLKYNVIPQRAVPAALASTYPRFGQIASQFGYGCTHSGGAGAGVKRRFDYAYGSTFEFKIGCPGDSGGPVAYAGGIFYVASGMNSAVLDDIYAKVINARPWLVANKNYLMAMQAGT